MSKTYEKPGIEVSSIIRHVKESHYPVLTHCEVEIEALFVADYDKESGGLKPCHSHGGYPAAASIAKTGLKERVLGRSDALMVIDKAVWMGLDTAEREALIDHELHHIGVVSDTSGQDFVAFDPENNRIIGECRHDDASRPVLKMKKHDWQFGGFNEVAKRHGSLSFEVKAVQALTDSKTGQYVWDFDSVMVGAA